ncbi:MAG: hypothetical protein ACPH7H_06140 [Porticoccaceae bacterium]
MKISFIAIGAVTSFRLIGYLLALGVIFIVEKLHGTFGLGIYGLLLMITTCVRFMTFGSADLYLLRGAKGAKNIGYKLYTTYMLFGFISLSIFILLFFATLNWSIPYFLKFELQGVNLLLIPILLVIRCITATNIARERISGGVIILICSYIIPYLFEIIFLISSSRENLACNLFLGHILGHIILNMLCINKIGTKTKKLHLQKHLSRFLTSGLWLFRLLVKKSFVLISFSFCLYGIVLLVRFLGSKNLGVEEFGVLTLLIVVVQAVQNLINTVVTINQAQLISVISSCRESLTPKIKSKFSLVNNVRVVVAICWLLVVIGTYLILHQSFFELPYTIVDISLFLVPSMLLVAFLDMTFFSQISAQSYNQTWKITRIIIPIFCILIFANLFVDFSIHEIVVIWLILNFSAGIIISIAGKLNKQIDQHFNVLNLLSQLICQLTFIALISIFINFYLAGVIMAITLLLNIRLKTYIRDIDDKTI